MNDLNQPEPQPTPNQLPAMWPLVIAQMQGRDAKGRADYGTPLQPFNGRNALNDLLDELLDAVVYLKQLQFEDALLDRPVIRNIITNIILTPAVSRDYGERTCPVCDLPLATDDDFADLDAIEEKYGWASDQYVRARKRFCNYDHSENADYWDKLCEVRELVDSYARALQAVIGTEIEKMQSEN